ncbi:NifB/NifX family molybdenum-iron cluster-binding protein [Stutzerimonas kirkiae]|uniref:NifB/NifX family molybdenum-iron cluster-binding protein n=1 Tax=Stutzerimonas kirkiae TaxID=2211392 RepID=UPI001038446D|nr:NifB/NifX family molybdenum-iron cluster-binding protein [Stutzerimonas kirkiae]TBV16794.1 nitrogen fixation protein NifY [Stutzerimonas kirkiae]
MAVRVALRRPQLPPHLALRIALAARELKGLDTAHLLQAVLAVSGEPITETRLSKLRAARLRARLIALAGELELPLAINEQQLQRVVGLLKGRGVRMPEEPLPRPLPYREGELRDSVRIACASERGEQLDGRFGSCTRFLIYQISPSASRLIALRQPDAPGEDEDRYSLRAELLQDCQLLYTLSIGGPAAAKVIRAGVHPVKVPAPMPVAEVIEELQQVLACAPPPWLAKAMGVESGQRLRFDSDERE